MATGSAIDQTEPLEDGDASLASRHSMGVKAVGAALRRARGRLSQQAAAERWNVPLATMAALEQGVERDYQAQTLAQFDDMLGRSTLDLYERPDEQPPMTGTPDELARAFVSMSAEISERVAQTLREERSGAFDEVAELWERLPNRLRVAFTYLLREVVGD
jgi:hypothetical protein